jgi:putative SOS response-associated peptidase YedK
MCGRYTFRSHPGVVAEEFDLSYLPPYVPRWNIAPTQRVPVIRMHDGKPDVAMLRWGLVPSWTADLKKSPLLINAKSETAATKPAFRSAFQRRRCLVLADGYYEWKALGKQKQPWYHRLKSDRPFAFAGLWERWEKGEKPIESCTILTTQANEMAAALHDRMPVILSREARRAWLDPEVPPTALQELLVPSPADEMACFAVNPVVNKAGNEGPECITPCTPSP